MASAADRNGVVGVWGSGFSAGEEISIVIASESGNSPVGSARANGAGAFSITMTVTVADGVYSLWAIGSRGTEATAPLIVGDPK